jgi:hypothetical protein
VPDLELSDLELSPKSPDDDLPAVETDDTDAEVLDSVEVDLESDPADTVEQSIVVEIDEDEYR